MRNRLTKVDKLARDDQFIRGVQEHLAHRTLDLRRQRVPVAKLVAQVKAHMTRIKMIDAIHASWLREIAAERADDANVIAIMAAVRHHVAAQFGEDSPEFSDFGFKPRKKRAQTVESKLRAAERMRATRIARGTLGKKQRLAIKGTVGALASESR